MVAKKICSFTLDGIVFEKLEEEADSDDRSKSSELNHILRDRYGV
ncbi:MAG: hypothetical protein OXK17_05100 [Thaumarchaeota archaeon]|nr:hypothetical protein [Nitrososphaerota archaeon]